MKTSGLPPILTLEGVSGMTDLGEIGGVNPLEIILRRGEIGVVLGGKETSSLLRLIMGLGQITAGRIILGDDHCLDSATEAAEIDQYRKKIGFAFRDKGLIGNLSLLDNVDLPAKYHGLYKDGERAGVHGENALIEVGVEPELWKVRPDRISWETRKKVLLARAIALNPEVLVLDDPATMLASPLVFELMDWLRRRQKKGTGILIGTNDYAFGLAVADWVLHPDDLRPTDEYGGFIDQVWIKTAELLKARIAG